MIENIERVLDMSIGVLMLIAALSLIFRYEDTINQMISNQRLLGSKQIKKEVPEDNILTYTSEQIIMELSNLQESNYIIKVNDISYTQMKDSAYTMVMSKGIYIRDIIYNDRGEIKEIHYKGE